MKNQFATWKIGLHLVKNWFASWKIGLHLEKSVCILKITLHTENQFAYWKSWFGYFEYTIVKRNGQIVFCVFIIPFCLNTNQCWTELSSIQNGLIKNRFVILNNPFVYWKFDCILIFFIRFFVIVYNKNSIISYW